MKRWFKSLFVIIIIICVCLVTGGTVAHAQKVSESDANDSMKTAQLIQANNETAAEA